MRIQWICSGKPENSPRAPNELSRHLTSLFSRYQVKHKKVLIPFRQTTMAEPSKIYADIDYEDPYVQPLLLAALKSRLPPELLVFVNETQTPPPSNARLLQWRQYEKLDFEHLLQHPATCLANSYVIRKALIRKHYLSTTVSHWVTKHPGSVLGRCVKGGVEFEVDYAEFLDEALVEAWELRGSWGRNEERVGGEREWWILKPGMSERGQGVRLFSSEEELRGIFEGWDPVDSEEEEEEEVEDDGDGPQHSGGDDDDDDHLNETKASKQHPATNGGEDKNTTGIITSQLRHFVAQPYIHPPLLLPSPHPASGRKFHIRTYVVAVGALKVYVYKPMLALFAAQPYTAPSSSSGSPNDHLGSHLTNTCLQALPNQREGSVHAFWSLPASLPPLSKEDWREVVFDQICAITAEIFEAAARTMGVHFQLLPNAFEIFGLDFMVDGEGGVWLLEVNAFPDFAQTGSELRGLVEGLFEGVVGVGVRPFFGLEEDGDGDGEGMVRVLDVDLGRR